MGYRIKLLGVAQLTAERARGADAALPGAGALAARPARGRHQHGGARGRLRRPDRAVAGRAPARARPPRRSSATSIDIARGLVIPAFGRPAASLVAARAAPATGATARLLPALPRWPTRPACSPRSRAALGDGRRLDQPDAAVSSTRTAEAPILIVTHRTERAGARPRPRRDRRARRLPRRAGGDPHRGGLRCPPASVPPGPTTSPRSRRSTPHHVLHRPRHLRGGAAGRRRDGAPARRRRSAAACPISSPRRTAASLGYAYAGALPAAQRLSLHGRGFDLPRPGRDRPRHRPARCSPGADRREHGAGAPARCWP